MYYRLILEGGHLGAGKSLEFVRYFKCDDPIELFSAAARMPRIKGKSSGRGVKLVEKVSREEYEKGRQAAETSQYLSTRKKTKRKNKHRSFH